MKAIALAAFLFFLILSAHAQPPKTILTGKISGRVLDSLSGAPLEYATVTLQQADKLKPVNGATTDKAGRFVLQEVPAGSYVLIAEFIGYKPSGKTNIVVDKTTPVDVKNIYLAKRGAVLEAVTVTAGARLIENKIDKLVYNAERDITAQSGSATDLLKKVPQVSVDIDGNVELAGSSGVRFLINGKPSAAFGSNVADVLQAIPASQIKSIEVVTSPGARYDAQGMGGIINIILKKSTAQGINGNLSLAAGTRAENGSFNFNARKGGFGLNAFVSGNYRPALNTPSTTDRTSTDTAAKTVAILHQDGLSRFDRHGFQSGVGFDWTPRNKNNFTGSLAYDRYGGGGRASINQSQLLRKQADAAPVSDIRSVSYVNGSSNSYNVDASLGYKRTFAQEDQELEISLSNSVDKSKATADNYQIALPAKNRFYGNQSYNPGTENELEVQADYVQPLRKDMQLGMGAKFSSLDISGTSTVLSYQANRGVYVPDPFLSNRLNYHQKVYALYSELSLPVSDFFDMKIGGRYERTQIRSYYSNALSQAGSPGYNTFVPSLFLSKKLDEKQLLKLSYSKRIERPDYSDLNPFINTNDPKNLVSGNPYLLPELGHRAELGYSRELGKAGLLTTALFYRINDHDIQPFIRYYPVYKVGDSAYTNVAVTMRQNIGIERNAGANLSGDLHMGSKFSVRPNLFFFHRHTTNTQDKGYNSTSFNYRFNVNAAYQFTGTLVAEFFGNFNSARNEAQGRYPSFTTYSMAARKQFWNKKGSLALTAANPFSNYVLQKTDLFGPNFLIRNRRQVPFRSFGVNFTWKFGRLEFKKDKEETENLAAPAENP